jgi:hypothetical protein
MAQCSSWLSDKGKASLWRNNQLHTILWMFISNIHCVYTVQSHGRKNTSRYMSNRYRVQGHSLQHASSNGSKGWSDFKGKKIVSVGPLWQLTNLQYGFSTSNAFLYKACKYIYNVPSVVSRRFRMSRYTLAVAEMLWCDKLPSGMQQ